MRSGATRGANGHGFRCPECAGSRPARTLHRSASAPLPTPTEVKTNPWCGVFVTVVCAGCGFHVPGHLAELWDGQTVESARAEWRQFYRPGAPHETAP